MAFDMKTIHDLILPNEKFMYRYDIDPVFDYSRVDEPQWKYWFAWRPIKVDDRWVWWKPVGYKFSEDMGMSSGYVFHYRLWTEIVREALCD